MSESTYLVTARKYRPLLFKEVVAQEHVTETLKNAIRLDRLAHAYLFTGPRGVGKTTAARILAKAINCTTPIEDREDRAEPCRECVSCKSFEQGRNMNIIEIDAASNNKVDDIRELRDTVRIPPQNNRMKVFIVDEVHMLSTAAFNALLKTLEEPPPHAMFIFATTEPHKVLPTIQSRCQRFDFRRIAVQETIERLKLVCQQESISADDASLMLIARKGDGALRDALSVFDQAISLCGTDIRNDDLVRALGVVDTDLFFNVTDAVLDRNPSSMLHIVDRVVRAGYDLQEFVDGLAEHLRNFLVARTVEDASLIEATEADRKKIATHSSGFSESVLLSLVHIVGTLSTQLRSARQPRLTLEMGLLRMASLPDAVDVRAALKTLDRIEKMAASGEVKIISERVVKQQVAADSTPAERTPGERTPGERTPSSPVAPKLEPSEPAPAKPAATTPPPPHPAPPEPAPESSPAPSEPPPSDARPKPVPEPPLAAPDPVQDPLSDPDPAPPPASPQPSRFDTESDPAPAAPAGPSLFGDAPAIRKPRNRRDEPSNAAAVEEDEDVMVLEADDNPEASQSSPEMQRLQHIWSGIVEDVMANEKQLGSFLRHARLTAYEGKTLLVSVPDDFHAKALRNERAKLAHRLTEGTGLHVEQIGFRVDAPAGDDIQAADDEVNAKERLEMLCEENPAVRALVERFGGEIVW
jgi:DNA polymerase-3 subunit gamma/tau